jgi:PAS domain S-box-containing protein
MATLRHDSLVWRLVALAGGAFAITALVVLLRVDAVTRSVIHDRGREVYAERTASILRRLEQQAARLQLTGQPDAYRADFQESILRELSDRLDQQPGGTGAAFILGRDGDLLLGAPGAAGTRSALAGLELPAPPSPAGGERVVTGPGGREQWLLYRPFPTWGWTVGYRVPMAALLADADTVRRQLVIVWVAVTSLMLLGLALLLRREVRPLRDLTGAAAAMAEGDLERDLRVEPRGEVRVLAEAFVEMRAAIRRQLAELRESEARYRRIFDAMDDGLLLLDQDGRIVAANPSAAALYGWSPQQLVGRGVSGLLREQDQELARQLVSPPADRPLQRSAITRDREGQELETEVGAVRLEFQGRPHGLVILRNVSEQRRLERQLLQSQKLESVGRLAGGVAHDFNNLLTPVLGYSEMLLADPGLGEQAHRDLEAIRRAGERARNLARQLLAFSRRQVLELTDLNLGLVVREFEPILRRTLREDIDLVVSCHDQDCNLHADLGQIEQIIMNLAINAMDAMPDGGRIEVTTDCRELDGRTRREYVDLEAGRYVTLTVRDTGPGIPEDLLDRVFEPFFTTKDAGKGTGLGLATIHGIVRQHGGAVSLRNHPTGGCEVEILLPCVPAAEAAAEPPAEVESRPLPAGAGETVVVVEDDSMVRTLVETLLVKHGYRVRAYADGRACLQALLAEPRPADLLLADVIMPSLNGPDLRDHLREAGFSLPVLFMSGYAGETLVRQGVADARADFLQKPLEADALLSRIRGLLAAARDAADRDAADPA